MLSTFGLGFQEQAKKKLTTKDVSCISHPATQL